MNKILISMICAVSMISVLNSNAMDKEIKQTSNREIHVCTSEQVKFCRKLYDDHSSVSGSAYLHEALQLTALNTKIPQLTRSQLLEHENGLKTAIKFAEAKKLFGDKTFTPWNDLMIRFTDNSSEAIFDATNGTEDMKELFTSGQIEARLNCYQSWQLKFITLANVQARRKELEKNS